MSKLKKILALSLSAALALALLAGCGGGNNSGNSGSNPSNAGGGGETGRVYWLNFKPELDETAQALAESYTEKTGVPVQVITAAAGTYQQTLTAEMDKNAPPTLFVIGNSAGVADWGEYAMDLTGTDIANELNTDAYNLYDDAGRLVSIGYCYECYGIIANPDLVQKAGHSMDEIKDFASLKAVVEDIHANAATLGFDAFTSCDMDDSSSWRFTGHMANLEYYYEQEGTTWTECPATISGKYMENFKNLYDLCINNSLTAPTDLATGGHDPDSEFTSGKAAFTVQGSWQYATYKDAVPNATMIPYYCGVEGEEKAGLNCGTENCWAINSKVSEADQKATMDFMVWLVSDPDASAKMVEQLGILPYKSAPESNNGFLNDAAEYTANGCYVMNWATNYQPNVDAYRATLVAALNQYNSDQSDANWETVKTAFVDGWAVQYQAVNG
mgnify:CR=1 FL=1